LAKQDSYGKFTVTMSASEYRMYQAQKTLAGQRRLKEIEQEVESERVVMLDMKNSVKQLKTVVNGFQFKSDSDKTFVKMINNQPAVIETGETGLIKDIRYITNGMELSHSEQIQLKELDYISYAMFQDNNLESPVITRQFYELKEMVGSKPMEYFDLALAKERTPEQTARLNQINYELSVEGKLKIQARMNKMETEIHNAEVRLGYKNEPLEQTGE
jgi:hypothetical protein